MANRTFLLRSNNIESYDSAHPESILCAASYSIPIFWYSLFDAEDAIIKKTPLEDGSDYEYLAYSCSAKKGLESSLKRLPKLIEYFGGEVGVWHKLWKGFIESHSGDLLSVETVELVMMDEPKVYEKHSKACIQAFNLPLFKTRGLIFKKKELNSNWYELLGQVEALDFLHELKDYMFCGYSWMEEVPWENKA
jgi:hypothetical protein